MQTALREAAPTEMYSNSVLFSLFGKVCMVENCLLNNDNILCCSDSSSAKFKIKRKREREGDMREIGEIFISRWMCFYDAFFLFPFDRAKFTYNNAKTSQPAVCLFGFAFFLFESARVFHFIYGIHCLPNGCFKDGNHSMIRRRWANRKAKRFL